VDSVYNTTDCLNGKTGGSELLLRLSEDSNYAVASFNIVVDPSTAPDTSCNGNTGGGPPPPGGTPPTGGPPPGQSNGARASDVNFCYFEDGV
jgi:hypothetical protein